LNYVHDVHKKLVGIINTNKGWRWRRILTRFRSWCYEGINSDGTGGGRVVIGTRSPCSTVEGITLFTVVGETQI